MTTEELAAALQGLSALPPLERARRARSLKKELAAALDAETAAGVAGAVAGGMTLDEVAAELGSSGPRLSALVTAHGSGTGRTGRPPGKGGTAWFPRAEARAEAAAEAVLGLARDSWAARSDAACAASQAAGWSSARQGDRLVERLVAEGVLVQRGEGRRREVRCC
jgi:hypothetical protein